MPTSLQLRLIHIAYRQAGLEEEHYRLILANVAGVPSAKDLTQASFEDVMAVLEDSGFRDRGKPADYWRGKVASRGRQCGERMAYKIHELAGQQSHYAMAGLCRRVSAGRTEAVEGLRPREAWNLIELLKAVIDRADQPEATRATDAPCVAAVASGAVQATTGALGLLAGV